MPILVLGTAVAGQAATTVTLSPAYGHPSAVIAVSRTSFGAGEPRAAPAPASMHPDARLRVTHEF